MEDGEKPKPWSHIPAYSEAADRSMIAGMRLRAQLGDERAIAFMTELGEIEKENRDPTPKEIKRLRFPPSPDYFVTTERAVLEN